MKVVVIGKKFAAQALNIDQPSLDLMKEETYDTIIAACEEAENVHFLKFNDCLKKLFGSNFKRRIPENVAGKMVSIWSAFTDKERKEDHVVVADELHGKFSDKTMVWLRQDELTELIRMVPHISDRKLFDHFNKTIITDEITIDNIEGRFGATFSQLQFIVVDVQ